MDTTGLFILTEYLLSGLRNKVTIIASVEAAGGFRFPVTKIDRFHHCRVLSSKDQCLAVSAIVHPSRHLPTGDESNLSFLEWTLLGCGFVISVCGPPVGFVNT